MRIFSVLIVNFILAIFISSNADADTSYRIKKGDSPYSIAKKFNVSSRDVMKVNNLKAGNLRPGTKITIPSGNNDSSRKNTVVKRPAKMKKSKNIVAVKHQDNVSVHRVKRGDTLLSLSRKYSVSLMELKEFNNLRSTKLMPGQEIVIKITGPKIHKVKKGDNLYQIAKRYDMDSDELMKINHLETDALKPGQRILLESDGEENEAKTYDAILSQAYEEKNIEQISDESKELSDLGVKDRLVLFAKKLLDIPYRFGGNSLWGIDCSAYVQRTYSVIGISLPRSAREQFTEGNPVDKEELSIGDLVFFRTYASFPSHVGIYLGNNLFIHASSKSKKVTIDSLDTPYYLKRFIGAKRLIGENAEKEIPERES
jgi:cell wall-associated NlpC family hydrolase